MRSYPKYKDVGVQWLGEIPEDWNLNKLSRLSYMKGRIGWQGLKQSEFTTNIDDPFLITGMNFKDGVIRWNEVYHISYARYEMAPEIQLKDNDVLITKDGTIGKLLFVNKIPYPYNASLNSHLLVFRPLNGSYYPKYLFYQLKSLPFKYHIELTKSGTTFFGITQEAVGQYKFILPSFSEQQQIASYLDHKISQIDALTEKKKQLIDLLKEERTAVINEAVTKGLDPDVPMKDSGIEWLGEMPEHWDFVKGKYLFKILSGYAPNDVEIVKDGSCQYFKVNDLNTLEDNLNLSNSTAQIEIESNKVYEDGIILFPKKGC